MKVNLRYSTLLFISLLASVLTQAQPSGYYVSVLPDGVSQGIGLESEVLGEIEVCQTGSESEFVTRIDNGSGQLLEGVSLVVNAPAGMEVTGVLSGGTLNTTGSEVRIDLGQLGSGITEVRYTMRANCEVLSSLTSGEIEGEGTGVSYPLIEYAVGGTSYHVAEPNGTDGYSVLSGNIETLSEPSSDGLLAVKGDELERYFRIENNGSGSIEELELEVHVDNDPASSGGQLDLLELWLMDGPGSGATALIQLTVPVVPQDVNTFTIDFSDPSLSALNLTTLGTSQSIYFRDKVAVTGCDGFIGTTYTTRWGCDGSVCNADEQEASSTVYINTQEGSPSFTRTATLSQAVSACGGTGKITAVFTNTAGHSTAFEARRNKATNVRPNVRGYLGMTVGNIEVRSSATGNVWTSVPVSILSGSATNRTVNLLTGETNGDLPAGISEVLAGESIEVRYDVTNSGCLYTDATVFSYNSTISYSRIDYSNSCDRNGTSTRRSYTLTDFPTSDPDITGPLNVTGNASDDTDLEDYTYTFSLTRSYSDPFGLISCNSTYYSEIQVPDGFQVASATWVSGSTSQSVTSSPITGGYRLTGGGRSGHYEVTFNYICPADGSSGSTIGWKHYEECCTGCRKLLGEETLDIVTFCSTGQGCAGLNVSEFTVDRTTFGWAPGSYTTNSLASTPPLTSATSGMNTKAGYPEDGVNIKITATVPTGASLQTSQQSVRVQFDQSAGNLTLTGGTIVVGGQTMNISAGSYAFTTSGTRTLTIPLTGPATLEEDEQVIADLNFEITGMESTSRGEYELDRLWGGIMGNCGFRFLADEFTFYKPEVRIDNVTLPGTPLLYATSYIGANQARQIDRLYYGFTATGTDDFPNEFRPLYTVGNLSVTLPDEYEYVLNTARYYVRRQNVSGGTWLTTANREPEVISTDRKSFSWGGNTPVYDGVGSYVYSYFQVQIQPDCDESYLAEHANLPYQVSRTLGYNSYLGSTAPSDVRTNQNYTLTYARATNQSVIAGTIQEGINQEVDWSVKVCNQDAPGINAYVTLVNPWLAIEPGNASTEIVSVKQTNGTVLNLENYGPLNDAFEGRYVLADVPNVSPDGCVELLVTASYRNCVDDVQDQIKLYSAWSSRADALNTPDVAGHTGSITTATIDCEHEPVEGELLLNYRVANMAMTALEASPVLANLCEVVPHRFEIQSLGTGNMSDDLVLNIELPTGISMSGDFVRFNSLSLNAELEVAIIAALITPQANGYTRYTWDLSGDLLEPLQGSIENPDLSRRTITVDFDVEGDCSLDPGLPIRVFGEATSNCQDVREIGSQRKLRLQGDFANLEDLDVTITAGEISTCSPSNLVTIDYTNQQSGQTIYSNELEVIIPAGLTFVPGTFSKTPTTITTQSGQTILLFDIANTASITFETTLDGASAIGQAVSYEATTTLTGTAFCTSSGSNCANDLRATTGTATQEITVTDQSIAVNITSPDTYPICVGEQVTLNTTITGGLAPFTYSWSPAGGTGATATVTPLSTTNYTVTVNDANGCSVDDDFTVTTHPLLLVSHSVVGTSCADHTDGSITTTVTTGIPPFTYLFEENNGGTWQQVSSQTTSATSRSYPNLGVKAYRITVTDANGCVHQRTRNVPNQGPGFSGLCVGKLYCGSSDVDVTFTVNRTRPTNTGSYTYQILSTPDQTPLTSSNNPGPFNGSLGTAEDQTYNNVSTGTYQITATDDNSCTITRNITIEDFSVTASTDESVYELCFVGAMTDVELSLSNNANSCTEPSEVAYTVQLEAYDSQSDSYTAITSQISTSDATYTFTDVATGVYRIKVEVAGCPATYVDFSVISKTAIRAEVAVTPVSCPADEDGTATIHIFGAGGLSYTWYTASPNTEIQSGGTRITGLAAGEYEVQISGPGTDCDGEPADPVPFTIEAPDALENLTITGDGDCSASATVEGGTAPYTFVWNINREEIIYVPNGTGGYEPETQIIRDQVHFESSADGTSATPQVGAGDFEVVVTDDHGCQITETLTIDRPAVDRRYEICMNWKTKSILETQGGEESIPTIQASALVAATMLSSFSNQAEECSTKQGEAVGESFKDDCYNVNKLNDELCLNYEAHYQHLTLYYYDRKKELVRTVPPAGVVLASSRDELPAHSLDTRYSYNTLGQLTDQSTPDGGSSNYTYNDLNQLLGSQNARHATQSSYDNLGRVISSSRDDGSEANNTIYTTPADWISYDGRAQRFLRNRISYHYITNRNGDREYMYYSYDPHGNVEWLVQEIEGFGRTTLAYSYDLISGNVEEVIFNKNRPDQYYHRYTYDEDNRLLTTETSKDGILWDQDANQDYYLHATLQRTELGEDRVQGCDYAYTIHGWMKGLNSPSLDPTEDLGQDGVTMSQGFAKDIFGMSLQYYQGDYQSDNSLASYDVANTTSLYNGNITGWSHQIGTDSDEHYNDQMTAYTYRYDRLNRLKSADFHAYNSTTNSYTDINEYGTDYSYDRNGNITELNRDGYAGAMDRLTYNYNLGTNQLNHVLDGITATDYNDIGSQSPDNYQYDGLGQLIRDDAEGITIEWNIYNKVSEVIPDESADPINQKPYLSYSYDAMGNRAKKMVALQPYEDGNLITPEEYPTRFKTTYYSCDPSGNVMGIYERTNEEVVTTGSTTTTGTTGTVQPQQCYNETPTIPVGTTGTAPVAHQDINAGETYYISGTDFNAGLNLKGGTLIISGSYNPSYLNTTSGTIYVLGTATLSWFNISENMTVYNYGTLNTQGIVVSGTLENYGTVTSVNDLNINSPAGTLHNFGTIDAQSNLTNNNIFTNEGPVTIGGNLNNNGVANPLSNTCIMTIAGNLHNNGVLTNSGTVVADQVSYLNGGAEIILESGGLLQANGLQLNGTLTNNGTGCSKVEITGTTTINGGAQINGPIDVCSDNLTDNTNGVVFQNGGFSDCSCELETPETGNYYKALYKLTEVPLYGRERLGQRNADILIGEKLFEGSEFQTAQYANDQETRVTAHKATLYGTESVEATAENTCLTTTTIGHYDPTTQTQTSQASFYGNTTNALAQVEDENGDLLMYAVGANYWGNNNTLLVYDKDDQLIAGQGSTTIDENSKPLFIKKPGTEDQYYLITRASTGVVTLHQIDASTATPTLTQSTDLSGVNWGRNMTAVELITEDKAYVYLTQNNSGTTGVFKVTIDETTIETPEYQTSYSSYDTEGNGQLEVSTDGSHLLVYQQTTHLGWFSHHHATVTQIPLGAEYSPADEGEGYPRTTIPVVHGNTGTGQLSHSADHDYMYYAQTGITALNETPSNEATYRQGVSTSSSMVTNILSDQSGAVRRNDPSGATQVLSNNTILTHQTDSKEEEVETQTYDHSTQTLTGFAASSPHRVTTEVILTASLDREVGSKYYELKDHLGNVRAVITDYKLTENNAYTADLVSYTNYYAFGMEMPGRNESTEEYRYGFNGMEKDDEIKGKGNSYDFGARMYDPRLGRWLSRDPLENSFPSATPYNYAMNSPAFVIDPDGQKPKFPWGLEYEFPSHFSSAMVLDFNYDKAQYVVTWWDELESYDPRYQPKTIIFKDEELYDMAKNRDVPNSTPTAPVWNAEEALEPYGKSKHPAMAEHVSGGHNWGSNSFYWSPWRGWTGGWAGAASSNEYTFIDNAYSDTEFNKISVMDGVITKMENYKYNADTDKFELNSTTTYSSTNIVKVEQWTTTEWKWTWKKGIEFYTVTHQQEVPVYIETTENSDGSVENTERWEQRDDSEIVETKTN